MVPPGGEGWKGGDKILLSKTVSVIISVVLKIHGF